MKGNLFGIPVLVDYELRRGLVYLQASHQIADLDRLCVANMVLPVTTEVLLLASDLWASLKRRGLVVGSDRDLSVDVIVAATARLLGSTGPTVIATENVRHLSRMADARHWHDIA